MTRIESTPKENIDFPIDYCISLPTPTHEKWDKDYNLYNKYLTKEIMNTQVGMSYTVNGVKTWWCFPAAQTHTQLDTSTIINDPKKLIGEWRIVCSRKVEYTDSAIYVDKKIYRDIKLLKEEKDVDALLCITDSKMDIYGTEPGKTKYKSLSKNYKLINGRFVMFFGISKASGGMAQIGIDKEGHLIINYYGVQERKIENQYITYESIVTQSIYKKQ